MGLNKNDKIKFEELNCLSFEIYKKYCELFTEYNINTFEDLKALKEEEDELISEIINGKYGLQFIETILDQIKVSHDKNNILGVFSPDTEMKNRHLLRPLTIFGDSNIIYKMDEDENESYEGEHDDFMRYMSLNNIIDLEFFSLYLSFLEDYIKEEKDESRKRELLLLKYNVLFLSPEIENKFIDNHFDIPKDIYIDSLLWAKYYRIPKEDYDEAIKDASYSTAFTILFDLLLMDNINYADEKNYPYLIDSIVKLKVEFMRLSNSDIEFLYNIAKKFISEDTTESAIVNREVRNLFNEKANIRSRHMVVY